MSSSDEDSISEAEVEKAIVRAMQMPLPNVSTTKPDPVKPTMCGLNKMSHARPSFTNKHRLIYQSFTKSDCGSDSDDSDSSDCTDDENVLDRHERTTCSMDKNRAETLDIDKDQNRKQDFYIDKSSASDIHKTDVDVFDLSNIDACTSSETLEQQCSTVPTIDKHIENKTSLSRTERKKEYISKDKSMELSSSLQSPQVSSDLYVNVDPFNNPKGDEKLKKHKKAELEVMKKSVIGEEFEKQEHATTTLGSVRQQKKQRKCEREKTKGGRWYNMPAPELTEERKHDFSVLQMRKALDPKRFYKGNDYKAAPKYFQFGKVVESASDFYNSRIPKKQRKATLVEELVADAQFRQYNKRKYEEIQEVKRQGKGPYRHMKRLRKRKR